MESHLLSLDLGLVRELLAQRRISFYPRGAQGDGDGFRLGRRARRG